MIWLIGGRKNGKRYLLLCERASELELQIELAKRLNLNYKSQEKELNNLYEEIQKLYNKDKGGT